MAQIVHYYTCMPSYNLEWHTVWKVIFKGANAHGNLEKAFRVDCKFRDYNLVHRYSAASIVDDDDLTFVDGKFYDCQINQKILKII